MSIEVNNLSKRKTKRELETELIEIRRNRCLELYSVGFTQQAIAKELNVSQALVSLDIAYIKEESRRQLNDVITDIIPLQWRRTRTALQFIQREAYQLWKEAKTAEAKKSALYLFSDAHQKEFELVANSTIIDEAIRFVSNNNLKEVLTQLGNKQK